MSDHEIKSSGESEAAQAAADSVPVEGAELLAVAESEAKQDDERAESMAGSAMNADAAQPDGKKGGGMGKMIAVLLLVLVLIGAGLAANGQLTPLLQQLSGESKTDVEPMTARQVTEAASESVVAPEAPVPDVAEAALPVVPSSAAEAEPVVEAAVEARVAEPEAAVTDAASGAQASGADEVVSSELLAAGLDKQAELQTALQAEIDVLNARVMELVRSEQGLKQALAEQQQATLAAQLRWLAAPESHLPQLARAWGEIAALPGLNDKRREHAKQMQQLAMQAAEDVAGWRSALKQSIAQLSVSVGEDLIPRPEHPSLAWVASQFHLRKAASPNSDAVIALRTRLLDVEAQLAEEKWPLDAEWVQLRAALMAHLKEHAGIAAEPNLPESFTAMRLSMQRLADAASVWLSLSQGDL